MTLLISILFTVSFTTSAIVFYHKRLVKKVDPQITFRPPQIFTPPGVNRIVKNNEESEWAKESGAINERGQ